MTIEAIGHRGARGLRPELTLSGFQKALDLGVCAIELDVGISRDHAAMVYHDFRLNPAITRNNQGRWIAGSRPLIRDLSKSQLQQYDVGRIDPQSPYAKQFPDQKPEDGARIPTLRNVVNLIRYRAPHTTIYIEAKMSARHPDLTQPRDLFADTLVDQIDQMGIASTSVVESFDWNLLARIRSICPAIKAAPITSMQPGIDNVGHATRGIWTGGPTLSEAGGSIVDLVCEFGCETWCSDHRDLTPERIGEAQNRGLNVIAWTVNRLEDMQRMREMGVDGIVTDYPDRLINFLNCET